MVDTADNDDFYRPFGGKHTASRGLASGLQAEILAQTGCRELWQELSVRGCKASCLLGISGPK